VIGVSVNHLPSGFGYPVGKYIHEFESITTSNTTYWNKATVIKAAYKISQQLLLQLPGPKLQQAFIYTWL
jgi:hypothetical protein